MTIFKNIVLVGSLLLGTLAATAQQDFQFSMYRYNMNLISPAYAGSEGGVVVNAGVRSQWVGVQGAPETFNVNVNADLGKNLGLGVSVINDEAFVMNETHVYADLSYKLKMSDTYDLFAGLKAGFSHVNLDFRRVEGSLNQSDNAFTQNLNRYAPNVGLGFYLRGKNGLTATVSAPGLLANDRYEVDGINSNDAKVKAIDDIHMYAGLGYDIKLSEKWSLEPFVLAKVVENAPISVDATATAKYAGVIDFGTNVRLDESVSIFSMFRFMDDMFGLGYAYEITTSELVTTNRGSHEVQLRVKF